MGRDLPSPAQIRKSLHVNLLLACLIGVIGDPRAVGRDRWIALCKLRLDRKVSLGEMLGQDLESDFSVQTGVFSEIDFAHAALAQLGEDLVVGEGIADHGTGTRSFSSSNQFRTTLIRAGVSSTGTAGGLIIRNRWAKAAWAEGHAP